MFTNVDRLYVVNDCRRTSLHNSRLYTHTQATTTVLVAVVITTTTDTRLSINGDVVVVVVNKLNSSQSVRRSTISTVNSVSTATNLSLIHHALLKYH